jgi:hypothetical protein
MVIRKLDGNDWRQGLLESARHDARAAIRSTLAAGVDPVEVQGFVAEHRGVFGEVTDVFGDRVRSDARRAADRLLDQTQPRSPAPTSGTGRPARPHAVRLDPTAALPWHQRVALPALPVTFAAGPAEDVVVHGQRFRPDDLAGLLAGC